MGWTYTHKTKGESILSFFEKEFASASGTIIGCKVVNKVAYMAYKTPDKVFALVCLLDYKPKQHFNFGYKDMDETVHPYYYDAPKSILDLLTPTDNESANGWRAECEAIISKNKVRNSLKVGDKIKFTNELSFGRYGKTTVFEVVDVKKGHYFAYQLGYTIKLTKSNLCNYNNPWVKI